jgi:glutamate 5-kinase
MTKKETHNLIVVKIGSSSLTDKSGKLDKAKLKKFSKEIASLVKAKKKVIIVTSGAIVCGSSHLGIPGKPRTIPEKQAAAAIGQSRLMHEYELAFRENGITAAQILLTRDAIADRTRYINARNTISTLLENGIVPIVNENDTVSVEEIKVGDNDTLSALVASLVGADLLVVLTDVDGFYMKDDDGKPVLVPEVKEITREMEQEAGRPSEQGTGGMITKVDAGKIAMCSGTTMVIANSSTVGIINGVVSGMMGGTKFLPKISEQESRKRWLANGLPRKGIITIDGGAETALTKKGGSLLAVGILRADGDFKHGDAVSIIDETGKEVARGLINYSKEEIDKIKGLKTDATQKILGYKSSGEVIHRDNMVIL